MVTRDLDNISLLAFQQPINCCNVTAIAYALTALGHTTSVDDIFYITRLPIATVLDDGMTLAETYDTFLSYVENAQLPLSVKLEHFDKRTMTFDNFIQEIEKAVCDDKDIHILNFSVSIAHDNFNLGGGHFSLVADYDPNTQEITIADTNPKKYTRFWKCPAERMYKACVDKDSSSTRSRGMIVVRKLDESHQ
ncbi:MAG: phytochelatin synthase family protein [Lyngbya sp.]|nr:phytochelatin synthase family protein [Lyngbya sp.]